MSRGITMYTCPHCGRNNFLSPRGLTQHKNAHHLSFSDSDTDSLSSNQSDNDRDLPLDNNPEDCGDNTDVNIANDDFDASEMARDDLNSDRLGDENADGDEGNEEGDNECYHYDYPDAELDSYPEDIHDEKMDTLQRTYHPVLDGT